MRAKILLLGGFVALAVLLALFLWIRGTPESRAKSLFSRLGSAVGKDSGSVGAVLDCLDKDYDVLAHWPEIEVFSDGSTDRLAAGRAAAKKALQTYFFNHLQVDRTLTTVVQGVDTIADRPGTYKVRAVINLESTGALRLPSASVDFTVVEHGFLLPTAYILDHPPLKLHK